MPLYSPLYLSPSFLKHNTRFTDFLDTCYSHRFRISHSHMSNSVSRNTRGAVSVGMSGSRKAAAPSNPYDVSGVGWASLKARFGELMELMDSPTIGIKALDAHAQHRARVAAAITELLDKAQAECRALLIQGCAEAAEEAGVKVLKLRERFHGPRHVALVPAYLHLARAKQFMERYGDAEEFLSLASYAVQKQQTTEPVAVAIKAELHQTYGLLYAADEKMEVAVKHLTCATYYMSCMHGPQHILTTFSYFDLGNVFAAKACMESAMAMYDNVKEIWYGHLTTVLDEVVALKDEAEKLRRYAEETDAPQKDGYPSAKAFGSENLVDASKMLHGIYAIQKERFRVDHPTTARAEFVLALFLLWVSDDTEAVGHLAGCHASSQKFYGPRHPVVAEIETWSERFGFAVVSVDNAENGEPSQQQPQDEVAEAESGDDAAAQLEVPQSDVPAGEPASS